MSQAPRNAALDGLRAIAVLLVLGRHAPPPLMLPWIQGGWAGVDLFFVISGFLVAGLLFSEHKRTGRIGIGRFLIRRGFKIYPAFYFMLVVSLGVIFARGSHVSAASISSELLFLQSYLPGVWNHTWSLAVEEHFYLLLALLLPLLMQLNSQGRLRLRALLLAYGFFACGCLWLRMRLVNTPYLHETHLFPTHLRIDSLFFGVVLGYLRHFHDESLRRFVERHRLPLVLASSALFSLPFWFQLETQPFVSSVGLTLIAWGSGGLLLVAYYAQLPRTGLLRLVAYVGANSYSIYLWHMPVLLWVTAPIARLAGLTSHHGLSFAIHLIACLIVGIAAASIIELPLLRLRDRIFPSRALAPLLPVTSSERQTAAQVI